MRDLTLQIRRALPLELISISVEIFFGSHILSNSQTRTVASPTTSRADAPSSLTTNRYLKKTGYRCQTIDSLTQLSCYPLILHTLLRVRFANSFLGVFFVLAIDRLPTIILKRAPAPRLFQRI